MKQLYILLLVLPLLCHSYPLDEANSSEDSEIAESEPQISKRSGGLDLVTHLKSGILASLGRASASIASGSSGSSSSYKSYDSGQSNSVEYDPWSLKKSVLNTLFQAVKAITGGVTALKGQLIKGSGYVLSAGGKLVAASGDKVTDVGKSIINSAQLSPVPQSHGSSHPFGKISSLSGGSSGSGHHSPGPVVHTETITTYEIPAGHHNYGPPSKPPSFSSATHQYLPPQSYSAGAPFASHAAFEAPSPNYLPSKYGPSYDGHDEFNIYGRHKKLSEKEVRKAANELQEILHLIPGKSKPDISNTINVEKDQDGYIYPDKSDYSQYDIPPLRQLESISHVEAITAAYGPPIPYKSPSSSSNFETKNPSDVYRQMAHRLKNSGKNEPSNFPPGYMYPNPQKATPLNSYPPSPAVLQNIVKSTSFQVNLDPYRPSDLDGSPLGPQQSIAQPYTYFNPAQNRIDAPHYDRRRDIRHPNIKNFEYIKDYRIRDPAKFNRKLMT